MRSQSMKTLCCSCLRDACCGVDFPACKVAMQSSLQASGAACISACTRHTFQNFCRQRSHAMGDVECKATAGMGHCSHLHHCPATAPRSRSVLAGLQPDRPCPGEVSLVPVFVPCDLLSSCFCHHFLLSPVIILYHGMRWQYVVRLCHAQLH